MITINDIRLRMQDQDNRITKEPIFVVQQRRRIYGIDTDICDDQVWLDADDYHEVTDPEKIAWADKCLDAGSAPIELVRTAYVDVWEFVQPFFSEAGARAYIDANRHNMTDPRIYVESAYRNDEWITVRKFISEVLNG